MTKEPIKYPEFASRFREACLGIGMDDARQDDLGKLIGVSGPMINYYRKGKKLPSMETAIRICEKTGVSLDWLLLGKTSSQSSNLREVWESAPPEEKVRFLADLASKSER